MPGSWLLFPHDLGARHLLLQLRGCIFTTFPRRLSCSGGATTLRPSQSRRSYDPRVGNLGPREGGGDWFEAALVTPPSEAAGGLSFPVLGAEDAGAQRLLAGGAASRRGASTAARNPDQR